MAWVADAARGALLAALTGLSFVLIGMVAGRAARSDDRMPFGALLAIAAYPGTAVPGRISGMTIALAILPAMLIATGQAAPPSLIEGTPLGRAIARAGTLPAKGCAAYSSGPPATARTLVAMMPMPIRAATAVARRHHPQRIWRATGQGDAGFGFAPTAVYRVPGDVMVTLDMTIAARGDLKDGAAVSDGTLRLDRKGQDGIVLPIVGLIGCT